VRSRACPRMSSTLCAGGFGVLFQSGALFNS
jgi:hypothetical protein